MSMNANQSNAYLLVLKISIKNFFEGLIHYYLLSRE